MTSCYIFLLQLSELEQRVVEAETRAEDAEDKVGIDLTGMLYQYIFKNHSEEERVPININKILNRKC